MMGVVQLAEYKRAGEMGSESVSSKTPKEKDLNIFKLKEVENRLSPKFFLSVEHL